MVLVRLSWLSIAFILELVIFLNCLYILIVCLFMRLLLELLIFFGLLCFRGDISFTSCPFCEGKRRGGSPSWIYVQSDMELLPNSDYISAIIDSTYHSFSKNYSDACFWAHHAIVFPTNYVANDINDVVLSIDIFWNYSDASFRVHFGLLWRQGRHYI